MPMPKHACTAEDYWALPDGVRAELIDGELWNLASPSRTHQEIVLKVSTRLDAFITSRNGACKVYPAPFAVNLFCDDSTFVEPDVSVICDRSKLSERGCEGAPDFVMEVVSPSSAGMDYISKLNLYREAGVKEYWVCDPLRERTMVYDFDPANGFAPAVYPFCDPVPSTLLSGFVVDFGLMLAGM